MTALAAPPQVGARAAAVAFGVAEIGAVILSGIVMVAVVIVSQLVRITQEAAERRRIRRART